MNDLLPFGTVAWARTRARGERRFVQLESGEAFQLNKKDAPDPPDYSAVAGASEAAAKMSYKAAQEQLAFARQQWASQENIIGKVLGVQLPVMYEQFNNAKEDRERYERLYQPLENNLVQEFISYDTPQRQAMEQGRAISEVSQAFEAQRANALRQLEGYGIDPSQTRSQALDLGMRTQQAAMQAGAATSASQRVEDIGRSLRAEAINIGKGMPSQVAGAYGQSLQAGQGANAGAAGWQNASAAMGSPTAWMGAGNQATATWGNTLNQGFQNQLAAANYQAENSPWNAVAGLAGGVLGAMKFGAGGEVDGPGGPTEDAIPARLSDGEYIIPADVVRKKGSEFFDRLVAKYSTDGQPPPSPDDRMRQMQAQAATQPRVTENPRDPNFDFEAFMRQIEGDRQQAAQQIQGLAQGGMPMSQAVPTIPERPQDIEAMMRAVLDGRKMAGYAARPVPPPPGMGALPTQDGGALYALPPMLPRVAAMDQAGQRYAALGYAQDKGALPPDVPVVRPVDRTGATPGAQMVSPQRLPQAARMAQHQAGPGGRVEITNPRNELARRSRA